MKTFTILAAVLAVVAAGCSGLILKPADFSWPIEAVMKPDAKGFVQDQRNNLSVNVKALLFAETGDSVGVTRHTIHMIRDAAGYYYVTAPKFKHVYVLAQTEGGLEVERKILIAETGLNDPAFNQRMPHVQLLNGKDRPVLLTPKGIVQGGGK